jgi:uncharacterized membrane protein (DUF106 family)
MKELVLSLPKQLKAIDTRMKALESAIQDISRSADPKRLAKIEVALEELQPSQVRMDNNAIKQYVINTVKIEVKKEREL